MDFSSDKADVFLLLLDQSDSMRYDAQNMRDGLRMFKESFENFSEVNSIAVSICRFSDSHNITFGKFEKVENLKLQYRTGGTTALNYAIVKSANFLTNYMDEVTNKKGIVPKATFIVFSDGQPCEDCAPATHSKNVIEALNYAGVTTVFVAFGSDVSSEYGKNLGFLSVIDVNNRSELTNFLGVELSKSCKEQSMSMKSLGANFFSKAAIETESEKYSKASKQALDDTDWIDDI